MWGGGAGRPGPRSLGTQPKRASPLQSLQEDVKVQEAFRLQSLVADASHGKGVQMIEEYLQREGHLPQRYNRHLLPDLDRSIHKELDGCRFQNVSALLRCVQIFFKDDLEEEEPLLIQQGLIQKIVSWFEKMMEFLTARNLTSDALLTSALEDLFESVLIISRKSIQGTLQMLDSFIIRMGFLVTEDTVSHLIRQEALSTLNCILDVTPLDERKKFSLAEGTQRLMKEFARTILTVGDYNQQTATSEALCRMTTRTMKDELVHQWFDDAVLAEAFKKIKNREFETDCRQFLNLLNSRLGEQRRVYSLPCVAAFADAREMRKPADEKLEEFWIDFNLGSCSITFYIDSAETDLWEPVKLWKGAVVNFSITESERLKTLSIYLEQPVAISKREARRVEFHFDVSLNVLLASIGALGGDKQILCDQMKIFPPSTRTFGKEDSKTASSQERQTEKGEESTTITAAGLVGAEDDRCLLTLRLNDLCEPPTTNAAAGSETREVDSAQQDVQEPVQSQALKLGDTSRGESAFMGNRKVRRMMLNSGKYLFSESDQDSSSGASQQSWATTHKMKSLKSYSRRRKLRVSSLKVLPLSPVSHFSPKKDQAELLTPAWKVISRQNITSMSTLPETNLEEHQSSHPLSPHASLKNLEVEEEMPQTLTQEPSMDNSVQHKLQNLGDREMPDGNSAAPEQSRSEEDASALPVSADVSAASVEDITENFCGPALTSAFENFTKELRRKCQEKIPLRSKGAEKAPDCLIKLWDQIHLCRLNKLEKFHTSVLQEWRSLEVDMQTLKHFEEDAWEFWEKQGADMKSFCDMQLPRLNLTQPS